MHKERHLCLFGLCFLLAAGSAVGAVRKAPAKRPAKRPVKAVVKRPAKPPVKRPAPNTVKAQAQLEGQNGQFGTVYSLQSGFNFAIISARYSLEPFVSSETITPKTDEKLLVLDVAIKNARPQDEFWATDDLFTAVDERGDLYPHRAVALESKGRADQGLTLRPGQGLGQPALKDPLRVAFSVPAGRRIVKIMVNQGRAGAKDEKVLRYFVAGATKAEAGEAGDPKNASAPLPAVARDPSDPTGAVALDEGKGAMGVYLPSGRFALRLDGFAYSTEPLVNGNAPEEGMRYGVATVTAKALTDEEQPPSMFDLLGGDDVLFELTDAEGGRLKPVAFRHAKRDEHPEHEFRKGGEYPFRVVFALPGEATVKKLVLAAGMSRKWAFDVSGVK